MPGDIFTIEHLATGALSRAVVTTARPLLRSALGLAEIERLYRRLPPSPPERFAALALEALDVELRCDESDLARVPARGAVVITANHPHGAIDGLALAALLGRVRPDVRVLANHWLAAVPELAATCFFVDPFGGPGGAERSRAGLRAAHLWLRRGGALVVFPAGEVAPRLDAGGAPVDGPWSPTVGRLAETTGAALVPVHIDGANSASFYRAGRLHAACRTALLGRELLKVRGRAIGIRFGDALETRGAGVSPDGQLTTAAARAAVDALHIGAHTGVSESDRVAAEVDGLPADACLVSSGAFRVLCAPAHLIPAALQEIGRLRERTYRAVGEGTGRERDLDDFDARYLHLFLWDDGARRIAGAYRLARTDAIVARDGVEGLYTRTLFHYDRAFVDRLGPALELGRSFVREEYQRHHSALLLLWKGIGRFVALHPECRTLFGPVSISARYSDASHALLMAFLEQNHRATDLAALVSALNPPPGVTPPSGIAAPIPASAEEASRLVAALEPDGKGMPVLLRQYLRLNARALAFNIDPQFGNALDALMTVDLTAVDRAILDRYFGKGDAERFLAYHRTTAAARAA